MMEFMAWLFASGHAVDVVLAVIAVDAIILKLKHWKVQDITFLLLPAVLILLGLRAALVGASWWWIALPLLASLPVHLADVKRRHQTR